MKKIKTFLVSTDPQLDLGAFILRIGLGVIMLLHGIGKLMDLLDGKTTFFESFDPFGMGGAAMLTIAVVAEFGCSILLILGVLTRLALLPLIATMGMAFFVFHANDDLMDKELPLIYLIGFIGIFFLGPGKHTLPNLQIIKAKTRHEHND